MKPRWKSAGYLGEGESKRLLTANSNPVSSVKKAICFCRWYVHFSPKYVSKNSRAASTSDTWRSRCLSLMVHLLFRCHFSFGLKRKHGVGFHHLRTSAFHYCVNRPKILLDLPTHGLNVIQLRGVGCE